jgi:ubiquinol-cytochrome c reductase iron-sulfur subunit
VDRLALDSLDEAAKQGSGRVSDAHDDNVPAVPDEEPIANPGLPKHTWRPTDVDPVAEKRAERQVAAFFGASSLFAILFVVAFFAIEDGSTIAGFEAVNLALGLALAFSLLSIGVGIIHWARKLMGDHEIVEMRHSARSPDEDREVTLSALSIGTEESGIARRPLIRNSLLGAMGLAGLPAIVLLKELNTGDYDVDQLYHTLWGRTDGTDLPKMRVARDTIGTPILASDLEIGDLVNCVPDGFYQPERYGIDPGDVEGHHLQVEKSKAALILLRMEPGDIKPAKGRENWDVNGIVAYSKICTHVGCPISLNERTTHHLLCPCHQSTFDLADAGNVIFGPAGRPLPQLQLEVDDEGYLVATSDFVEPVGPSFWERDYFER